MVNLISISDFTAPYNVPFLNLNTSIIDEIISQYQKEILVSILGIIEYTNFENDFVAGVPVTQKWLDFLNGKSYDLISDNGNTITVNYKGVKPILIKMLYYFVMRGLHTVAANSTEIKFNNENAKTELPAQKMIMSWKQGLDLIGYDCKYLFEQYEPPSAISDFEKYKPTAYNFLYQTYKTDFPDWNYSYLGTLTQVL